MSTRPLVVAVRVLVFATVAALPVRAGADDPPPSPPVDGPIPALPNASLFFPSAPTILTGPNVVHEGVATWGPNLVLSPFVTSRSVWEKTFFPLPSAGLDETAAPSVIPRAQQATDAASSHADVLDPSTIGDAFALFDTLESYQPGASAHVTVPDVPNSFFLGYQPLRARWLGNQWAKPGPFGLQPEKKYSYAAYAPFGDVRLRGARLYCAARRAQFESGGQVVSLGERVGFSVKVFGHSIDFLVVEPTLTLGGPERFIGELPGGAVNDGAQAFDVPILLGTRVTPIRGLGLPGFGEVRVPLDLVSVDTEVKTLASKRPVLVGYHLQCPPCAIYPDYVTMHSKEYRTVTHTDGLTSAGFSGGNQFKANAEFTLFYAGPVRIFATLDLGYEVGALEPMNDRVLQGFPPGWPPQARGGHLLVNPPTGVRYNDGPWAFGARRGASFFEWRVLPEGTTDPFWRATIGPLLRPHDVRAVSDDDHAVESVTSLGLQLGLGGELGVDAGPFELTLNVTGSVGGTVAQHHRLRDALMAQDPLLPPTGFPQPMRPITAVTVRPRQTADVTFGGLTAKLHFYLDLGFFGEIDFEKTFFKVASAPLYSYDTDDALHPDDERFVFRLGTGSSAGQPMTKPLVVSHLPLGPDFQTFDQDVAACLADTTPPLETPGPCAPVVDSGATPREDVCLYGPDVTFQERPLMSFLPPGVCTNIGGWVASLSLEPAQETCVADYMAFLCAPVSKQQQLAGVPVVSRVWNLDPTMSQQLEILAKSCAEAFVDHGEANAKIKAKAIAEGLVSVSVCRPDGSLIPDEAILQLASSGPPLATQGPPCQN